MSGHKKDKITPLMTLPLWVMYLFASVTAGGLILAVTVIVLMSENS
jgi:hypothetical protein